MSLKVVGAGVGRTGTNSLKVALERLLGGRCHHMFEVIADPTTQIPAWTAAVEGQPVDWAAMTSGFEALVDWPGASFWPELTAANPEALVLLSVREPEAWYRSASNSIFLLLDAAPPELAPWMATVRSLLAQRFCDRLDDATAMMDAFERHNAAVRAAVPPSRLLEWTPSDGWQPICERLGVAVPAEPFPVTNQLNDWRSSFGMPPVA